MSASETLRLSYNFEMIVVVLYWTVSNILYSFTVMQNSCEGRRTMFPVFCEKAIHWVIGWCQRWRLYGNNFWYCSCYPEGFHLVSFKFANEHFLNCFMSYSLRIRIKNRQRRDFPSGRWLRIFLPVQWTWVWSLVQELRSHMPWGPSTATTEPTWCTYQSLCALEPLLCKKRSQQNQKHGRYN